MMYGLAGTALPALAEDSPALGSAAFRPSPQVPVGWRGDGTGRYPAAIGPIAWGRQKTDSGYTASGILWMAPLPNKSVSSPIIVGDRIFLTAEGADVVCVEKKTGRILWIGSNLEFEGTSPEDRKANPAYGTMEAFAPQLAGLNAEAVEALNAELSGTITAERKVPAVLTRKRELEKKIRAEWIALNHKKDEYSLYGAQNVFGYAGPTLTSDGKHVFAFFTTGVSVCYDLDGNRKWITLAKGGGAEHGNFASPILCDNQFIVWGGFETRSYAADSGKLLWSNDKEGGNTYGSLFRFKAGNEWVAAFQSGFFSRVRDGAPIWNKRVFSEETSTPIVEGDMIYAFARSGQDSEFKAFKIPSSTDSGTLTPAFIFKTEWDDDLTKKDFQQGNTASPLFVNGLVYRMTQGGGLIVNDAATGDLVYHKKLPMKPHTEYWNWAGASASPTLAGKYIYLMDNQGTTVIIEPGRQYKEVAKNVIDEVTRDDWKAKGGKSQTQNLSTPIFEGTRMYYRTDDYLYCIGR